jgi:hypothetical protein
VRTRSACSRRRRAAKLGRSVTAALLLNAGGLLLVPDGAAAQSPHVMVDDKGEIDMEACGFCHDEDMGLQRSKLETCTLCHSETIHAGSLEHLRALPASVAQRAPAPASQQPHLPLTDEGGIYCGTCHLFHDPALGEPLLPKGWLPPATGFPGAVRESLLARWEALAQRHGESEAGAAFATKPTRYLRLPVADGSLCLHCHSDKEAAGTSP